MRLEPRVQLRPMDFSGGIGALDAAAGNKSRPPDGAVVVICGVRDGGRVGESLRFALTSRKIGGDDANVFVACPTHARTTWSLSREIGFAGHALSPLRGEPADK